MKTSQLQALVSVADHGSFSTAALELGVTQSTVSHAIASLEAELGIVLLARGRHGAVLTPEGEQIIQEARQVLHLLGIIQQKAESARGMQTGQVRVATVRSVATRVLPEVIARFRQQCPRMTVAIIEFDRYAEVEQILREGRAEVGLTSLPSATDLEIWELFRDEFIALLPPQMLQDQESLTWERLTSQSIILNQRNSQHNKVVREHLAKFGYNLKIDYEVREDSTLIAMIQQGLGVTIMPRLAAEPIPNEIQVRSLPVPLERAIGVAILANALLPRAVFAFLDVLKSTIATQQRTPHIKSVLPVNFPVIGGGTAPPRPLLSPENLQQEKIRSLDGF